jgi:hypothetical protein
MIVEASNKDEFVELAKSIDRDIYVLYRTSNGDMLLRPTVTSKGRDTFVLKGTSEMICDEIEKWYGKALHIKSFSFKEDIMM